MPTLPSSLVLDAAQEPDVIRVLLTGFGPFRSFENNPSWLAVSKLHNVILEADPVFIPVKNHNRDILIPEKRRLPIHITALQIPVIYSTVLSVVPGVHARPPVLPNLNNSVSTVPSPPPHGYDFILHVGVAGPGKMRVEIYGHKTNYQIPDVNGELPPVVCYEGPSDQNILASEEEKFEMERAGMKCGNQGEWREVRGFGKGYEKYPELLQTEIDGEALVEYLNDTGVDQVRLSVDAGHYLCDFINYCSLAESSRTASSLPVDGKKTKVLFLHCPPVDDPLSTDDVVHAIKSIVGWVCHSAGSGINMY